MHVPNSTPPALARAGVTFRHYRGFRVYSHDGNVGYVEDVLFGHDRERPLALAVRSGLFHSRIELVAFDDIVEILPSERRLVVTALSRG